MNFEQERDWKATKDLWVSVVERAIKDVQDGGALAEEAVRWFRSTSCEPSSFLWICREIDLPAEKIKRQVFTTLKQTGAGTPDRKEKQMEFKCVGEFFHSVRFRPQDRRLQYVEAEKRAQSMGVGVEGGFAVPTQFWNQIMATPTDAAVRPRATVLPAGSPPDSSLDIPTLDGDISAQWVAEGATKPEDSFTLRQASMTPHELCAHAICSDKLLRNWQAGDVALQGIFRRSIASAEDTGFLTGTGVGQPLGIVNSPASIGIGRAGAGAIAFADVHGMLARLLPGGSPVWVASPTAIPQLAQMVDAGNTAVWKSYTELMGLPLIFSRRLPALGTAGDLILCDFSQYLIKDGSGPFVAISKDAPSVFVTNQVLIKVFFNVDGQPWLSAPVALEGAAGNTVSPFVILN